MDGSDSEEEPQRILEREDVVVIGPKRRRGNEAVKHPKVKPPTDGELTVTVYIVSISAVTNNFSVTLRSTSFKISNAARYLTEIDPVDALNNTDLPKISAEVLHGLVIRHFGEQAHNVLERALTGLEPRLMNKSTNTTNPDSDVSLTFQVLSIHIYNRIY